MHREDLWVRKLFKNQLYSIVVQRDKYWVKLFNNPFAFNRSKKIISLSEESFSIFNYFELSCKYNIVTWWKQIIIQLYTNCSAKRYFEWRRFLKNASVVNVNTKWIYIWGRNMHNTNKYFWHWDEIRVEIVIEDSHQCQCNLCLIITSQFWCNNRRVC